MNTEQNHGSRGGTKFFDSAIQILLVLLLIVWSAMIVLPFASAILWGVILAITLYPLFARLQKLFRGRKIWASTVITLLMLGIILAPTILVISSVINEIIGIKSSLTAETFTIPPPNPKVSEWPVIGKPIFDFWTMISTNLESAMVKYRDQILDLSKMFVGAMKSLFSNVLVFSLSILLSGVFLALSDKMGSSVSRFSSRLVGENSGDYLDLIVKTVRNVAKGIIGVAFIQFLIMGICFMLAGVPFAGLLGLLVFLLALVQLPGALVAIPVIVYVYTVKEPVPATIWAVIILVCGMSDNVLKPWLMGKGAPVPMVVIFLGALGGFVLSGFIGLFTGAVVLSLMYKITGYWMEEGRTQS